MIYAVLPQRRIIRVYHGALDLPPSHDQRLEGDARIHEMAVLISQATGLRKPRRMHRMPWLNAVDFIVGSRHFEQAAVAARVAFRAEAGWLREAAV